MKQSASHVGWTAETCLAAIHSSLVPVYTLNNLSPVLYGIDYAHIMWDGYEEALGNAYLGCSNFSTE